MVHRALSFVLLIVAGCMAKLDFECDPYGNIYMDNPDPELYLFAHAVDYSMIGSENQTNFVCQTYMPGIIHPTIVIEPNADGYCVKGRPILLTLSNVSMHDSIIVSVKFKQRYIVRCNDITNAVTVNVTQDLKVMDAFDDVPVDYDIEDIGVEPNFEGSVRSRLLPCCELNSSKAGIKVSQVGTHLLWTLDVYNDYYLLPLMCRAHAGQNSTGSPSAVLIDDGCAVDPRLVTHREVVDSWTVMERRTYVMNLFAFHFYSSHHVTILCHVKVCPKAAPEECEWACPIGGDRKRRSARASRLSRRKGTMETTSLTVMVEGDLNAGFVPAVPHPLIFLCVVTSLRRLS